MILRICHYKETANTKRTCNSSMEDVTLNRKWSSMEVIHKREITSCNIAQKQFQWKTFFSFVTLSSSLALPFKFCLYWIHITLLLQWQVISTANCTCFIRQMYLRKMTEYPQEFQNAHILYSESLKSWVSEYFQNFFKYLQLFPRWKGTKYSVHHSNQAVCENF